MGGQEPGQAHVVHKTTSPVPPDPQRTSAPRLSSAEEEEMVTPQTGFAAAGQ